MGNIELLGDIFKSRKRGDKSAPPLMDAEALKSDLVRCLADLKLPAGSKAESWDDLVQFFPAPKDDESRTSGVRMRLALRLFTSANTYLLSVMECLDFDSRGVYLIAVHVNWTLPEQHVQKLVEESYQGHFDDVLRARHTLWAQTFRPREFSDAVACCFKAILSHELIAAPDAESAGQQVLRPQPAVARFPKPDES